MNVTNPIFTAPDSRYRISKWSVELLFDFILNPLANMVDGKLIGCHAIEIENLPEDVQICDMAYDHVGRYVTLRLWSAAWEPVDEFDSIPEIDIMMRSHDFKAVASGVKGRNKVREECAKAVEQCIDVSLKNDLPTAAYCLKDAATLIRESKEWERPEGHEMVEMENVLSGSTPSLSLDTVWAHCAKVVAHLTGKAVTADQLKTLAGCLQMENWQTLKPTGDILSEPVGDEGQESQAVDYPASTPLPSEAKMFGGITWPVDNGDKPAAGDDYSTITKPPKHQMCSTKCQLPEELQKVDPASFCHKLDWRLPEIIPICGYVLEAGKPFEGTLVDENVTCPACKDIMATWVKWEPEAVDYPASTPLPSEAKPQLIIHRATSGQDVLRGHEVTSCGMTWASVVCTPLSAITIGAEYVTCEKCRAVLVF